MADSVTAPRARILAATQVPAVLLFCFTLGLAAQQPSPPAGNAATAQSNQDPVVAPACEASILGSPYIPVDSWVYPAMLRLYSLGFVDHVFLGMRPWTRGSVIGMLDQAIVRIQDADPSPAADEATAIYESVLHFVRPDMEGPCLKHEGKALVETTYTNARGITGTPLRDSYHLGSTIINDYGRPYSNGLNSYTGASGYATMGRFALYARGEFQGAPSNSGYPVTLADTFVTNDNTRYTFSNAQDSTTPIPLTQQYTVPGVPSGTTTTGRVMEAFVSAQFWNHVLSFGKQDDWLGPGMGAGMAYSDNAEDIYSLRLNRIEPLHIPGLSRITGPFRYDFLIGPLKGHSYPVSPWTHVEQVSFKPTKNLELGFERTVIWGGVNHEPVNLKSFLRSFFSASAPQPGVKYSTTDPGARFASFNFSYRLPFVRNWLTLYSDSFVHDDISPADAPRHSAWRPGIYLSHLPAIPKLDLRLEGISTDPPYARSNGGVLLYWETVQRQGYTNSGQIFGDWMGREGKGGQAWMTWHLSGNEWIQANFRHQKNDKDFILGGTTLNDFGVQMVKRIHKDLEIEGSFTYEKYVAPIYLANPQTVTTTAVQVTWYPQRKVSF